MLIYFIVTKDRHYVKIGVTTDLSQRLVELCKAHPTPDALFVFHVLPGSIQLERYLHRKWEHLQTHREWFIFDEDIKTWIQEVGQDTDMLVQEKIQKELADCGVCGRLPHRVTCGLK